MGAKRILIGLVCLVSMVFMVGSASLAQFVPNTDYDFGGETVTLCSWNAGIPSRFQPGGAGEGLIEQAEALFNCKIEFQSAGWMEYDNFLLTRYMAGDATNDIWQVASGAGYWPLIAKGALLPLDEVLGDAFYERLHPLDRWKAEAGAYKGQRYLMTAAIDIPEEAIVAHPGWYLQFYNKTMIEEAGAEDPYELWLNGEYDWDAYSEIMRKVTMDTNGDGTVDQWGMSTDLFSFRSRLWIHANGGCEAKTDENGRAVFALDDGDAARVALEQLRTWQHVDKTMQPPGAADPLQEFIGGRIAFFTNHGWDYWGVMDNADFEWGILPLPKGPNVDEIQYLSEWGGYALPASAKQPEALMALFVFLYRGDDEAVLADAEGWNNLWASERDYVVANAMLKGFRGNVPGVLTDNSVTAGTCLEIQRAISWEQRAFSEVVAEYKPVLQGLLDDLFGQ